jgi:hypothetical protein
MLFSVIFTACSSSHGREKEPVLIAGREAPLGWVTLKLYADNSFDLINGGMRASDSESYPGSYRTVGDTLIFAYRDSVPDQGCDRALRTDRFIVFDGCLGSLEIQNKNPNSH